MEHLFDEEEDRPSLTDKESFMQLIEGIAARRSGAEKREYPRFPSAEFLSGTMDDSTFSGLLIADNGNGSNNGGGSAKTRGFNLLNFSELGLQVQFSASNVMSLFNRAFYVEMGEHIVKVSMRWLSQSENYIIAGLTFDDDIDRNYNVARIIANKCHGMVNTMMKKDSLPKLTENAGMAVLAYAGILYSARIELITEICRLLELAKIVKVMTPSNYKSKRHFESIMAKYSRNIQIDTIRALSSHKTTSGLIAAFMKPFHDHGCVWNGEKGNIVFMEKDFLNCIMNSALVVKLRSGSKDNVADCIRQPYNHFLTLKEIWPDTFNNSIFIDQFYYYSHLLIDIGLLHDKLVDSMCILKKRSEASIATSPPQVSGH